MTEVLSDISSAMSQTFASQLTRVWNRQARLARYIPVKVGAGQGGGKNVAWDVEISGAGAASFAEGSDVSGGEFLTDPFKPATLPWGQYRSAFALSNLEMNAAASNIGNATAIEDIVGERFLGSLAKMVSRINIDCFSGTGLDGSSNPNIIGLDSAIGTSSTYAGINRGTYTEWAGNVASNGGTGRALTLGVLAASENLAFIASGMAPSILLTTPSLYATYEGLFNPNVRVIAGDTAPTFQGSQVGLGWRGNKVDRDKDATSGNLYMINPEDIEFCVLPWSNVADGIKTMDRTGESSNGDESTPLAIPFKCYPLARTGSAQKFVVEIYCQLKVKRPNAHVIVKDLQ